MSRPSAFSLLAGGQGVRLDSTGFLAAAVIWKQYPGCIQCFKFSSLAFLWNGIWLANRPHWHYP